MWCVLSSWAHPCSAAQLQVSRTICAAVFIANMQNINATTIDPGWPCEHESWASNHWQWHHTLLCLSEQGFTFPLFIVRSKVTRHCCPQAGYQEPGTIIWGPVNNKVCACALAKVTLTKRVLTAFSMPSRLREGSCWLYVIQLFHIAGFWARAAQKVLGSSSAPGMSAFKSQR